MMIFAEDPQESVEFHRYLFFFFTLRKKQIVAGLGFLVSLLLGMGYGKKYSSSINMEPQDRNE